MGDYGKTGDVSVTQQGAHVGTKSFSCWRSEPCSFLGRLRFPQADAYRITGRYRDVS